MEKRSKLQVTAVFLAFLAMGFGDAVGPFVGLVREHYQTSNFLATLIPSTSLLMFLVLSIPMGIYQDKKGKKHVMVLGLAVALIGLVIPIIGGLHADDPDSFPYPMFLLTVLLLGAGATILQVAGNPIMRDVSPEGKYSRNLSLAQFVKAIGSLSGPLIPVIAARYLNAGWEIIFPIYSVSLLITLAILVPTPIKEKKDPDSQPATFRSSFALLKNPFVAMMTFGIFVYVGAEVSVSSGIPLYLEDNYGIDIQKLGLAGTSLFFFWLMTGRFLGAVILTWMKASKFLIVTTIFAVAGILLLLFGGRAMAIPSISLIGISFANIFPLIFSITIDDMPERTNELSGLMITAIVGGAVLPPLMGKLADLTNTGTGFLVPLAAILYILYVALVVPGKLAKKAAQ
jgi:fucose permease